MSSTQLDSLSDVINVKDLMERCLGNIDFAERILTVLQTRCDADLADLSDAIQGGDIRRAERIAHRLKGACANAGAQKLSECASELCEAAKKGELGELPSRLAQLQDQWNEVSSLLPGAATGAAVS